MYVFIHSNNMLLFSIFCCLILFFFFHNRKWILLLSVSRVRARVCVALYVNLLMYTELLITTSRILHYIFFFKLSMRYSTHFLIERNLFGKILNFRKQFTLHFLAMKHRKKMSKRWEMPIEKKKPKKCVFYTFASYFLMRYHHECSVIIWE